MKVVIDHIAGSRQGQRQELASDQRIRFGRHPDCEVSFDPQRDIDASSRHAELTPGDGPTWRLIDLGSSNGTFVEGGRVTECEIEALQTRLIEFGPGGPLLRLFIGDEQAITALPPPPRLRKSHLKRWLYLGMLAVVIASIAIGLGI